MTQNTSNSIWNTLNFNIFKKYLPEFNDWKLSESYQGEGDLIDTTEKILPKFYQWKLLDPHNQEHLHHINNFLRKNYFLTKAKYQHSFNENYLQWLLRDSFCLGIISKSKRKLLGIVCGNKEKYQINEKNTDIVNIFLLCTRLKHRKNEIARYLIKGIHYYYQMNNIQHGLVGTNVKLPISPFLTMTYYIRPINTEKMLTNGIISYDTVSKDSIIKYYDFDYPLDKYIVIQPQYYKQSYEILNEYLEKYNVHQIITFDEFLQKYVHHSCIKTLVHLKDNNVTEIVSYCMRPFISTIKNQPSEMLAAQLLIYTSNDITSYTIIKNVLAHAKIFQCDFLVISDDLESEQIGSELKWIKYLDINCYFLNEPCQQISTSQVSVQILN